MRFTYRLRRVADRHDLLSVSLEASPEVHGPTDVDRGSPVLDSSTAIPSLRRPDLENATFVLPPFAEQRRIVAVIEEQFSRLDDVEHALRNVQLRALALTRAATRRAFIDQWPRASSSTSLPRIGLSATGSLCPSSTWKTGSSTSAFATSLGTRSCCRAYGEPRLRSRESTSARHCNQVTSWSPSEHVRPRRALFPTSWRARTSRRNSSRHSNADAEARYLAAFLRASLPRGDFASRRGVAVKGVNIGDLRQLPVPLPPLDHQHRIVGEVEHQLSPIDALCAAVESARSRAPRSARRSSSGASRAGSCRRTRTTSRPRRSSSGSALSAPPHPSRSDETG